MKNLQFIKSKKIIYICIFILISIYLIFCFYFKNHFLFRTSINGVSVSLKTVEQANEELRKHVDNYNLKLIEREFAEESIKGEEINLSLNSCEDSLSNILSNQKRINWICSFFKETKLEKTDLFRYDESMLSNCTENLSCINSNNIVLPKNPTFQYSNYEFSVIDEVYGNLLNKEQLYKNIQASIVRGDKYLDLDTNNLYVNPKYKSKDKEVIDTNEKLNKYVSSKIVYTFSDNIETLDGDIINQWLNVNDDMEINFDKEKIKLYLKSLAEKYDTLGKERIFKTSTGKTIKLKSGNYGFKINITKEIDSLIENIKNGQSIMKEPIYLQKAFCRNGDDDIGDTYVEVNITTQRIWFYKNGKLVASGDVVTGNINKGNGTHLGVYELNYKQKNATLKGENYRSDVTYWMPFDGNIGLHDASWRNSFGGNIYKSNGTHGCVNLPIYLAKKIYSEIEAGTPVICYTED